MSSKEFISNLITNPVNKLPEIHKKGFPHQFMQKDLSSAYIRRISQQSIHKPSGQITRNLQERFSHQFMQKDLSSAQIRKISQQSTNHQKPTERSSHQFMQKDGPNLYTIQVNNSPEATSGKTLRTTKITKDHKESLRITKEY